MTAQAPESLQNPAPHPERFSLFAGLAVAVVGAAVTFHLSSAAAEIGGSAARRHGDEIAMAGAVLSVMWAIVAARFARGLATARRWSDALTRRLAMYTPGVALTSAVVAAGATWSSLDAAYAAANASRSDYRQLEMGGFEAFFAGAVGAGLFFAVLRAGDASPILPASEPFFGDEKDEAEEPSPRPGALVAATAGASSFVVVTLVLGHAMDWAGLTSAAVSLAIAAVVYEALRPSVDAEGSWPRVRAGVAAVLGVASFGLAYRAIAFAYAQANASSTFRWDRQEMGVVETGIAGAVAAAVVVVVLIATRTRHERATFVRRFTLHKLVRAGLGVATMFGLAFLAIAYFEWHGLLSLAAGGIGGATLFIVTQPSLRSMAGDDGEVGEALGQLDRAERRGKAALVASGVVGVAVFAMLWMVLSALRIGGLVHFFGIVAASAGAALMVHRALKAPPGEASYQGLLNDADEAGADIDIFSDSLEGAQIIELNQHVSLASLLMGGVTKSSYQLRAGSSWCGEAKEKSGLFSRLFIGGRRALDVEVGDGGKEPSMRLERPFVWWRNQARVWVGERQVGTIRRRWSLIRRRYLIQDAQGRELYTVLSGAILWWRRRFRILHDGRVVGEMKKLKLPWYKRLFRSPLITEQDRFHLELPGAADLDARRLLVGSTLMVDITHFPTTQNARVGGLLFALTLGLLSLAAPGPDDSRTAVGGDLDDTYAPYEAPEEHRPQSAWEGRDRGANMPAGWDEPSRPAPTRGMLDDEDRFDDERPGGEPSFEDTDDAVAQIRSAAKSDRRRMLALALEAFSAELYGPGYQAIARSLAKTSDDDLLALAVLPLVSRHLGARGCEEQMTSAMSVSSARPLTKCRPDGQRLPVSSRRLGRAKLWAAALALDLELKARDEGMESDPLHRLAVKVFLAQR